MGLERKLYFYHARSLLTDTSELTHAAHLTCSCETLFEITDQSFLRAEHTNQSVLWENN